MGATAPMPRPSTRGLSPVATAVLLVGLILFLCLVILLLTLLAPFQSVLLT